MILVSWLCHLSYIEFGVGRILEEKDQPLNRSHYLSDPVMKIRESA
jgi:hypothetical protein